MSNDLPGFRLRFLGAAGTVTGSRMLVDVDGHRLLVDCGLFQGYKPLRLRNWAPFPVPPASIDAVLLTHAHLDHSGYLPRLVREGFAGPILCAPGTTALCRILLPDSASLLEEEAEYANRKGASKHHPALPLYTRDDARRCLERFEEVAYEQDVVPVQGTTARFRRQGHILGAASVRLEHGGARLLFSGDIGRADDLLMRAPEPPPAADWIVCESTYGNRRHAAEDLAAQLAPVLRRVFARGGVAIIPAFAVGRVQMLMHVIADLQARGDIPPAPLYLNSPMAADVTDLLARYADQHRVDARALAEMRRATQIVNSVEESKALNRRRGPMAIIAGSGMVTGGRVLHHIVAFGADHRNAIVLSGFQAGGTRGAALARGDRTLRIFGQDVAIGAEVVALDSASAHADADGLLAWLRAAPARPRTVFLTHGEPDASDALRLRIERELGWDAHVAEQLEAVDLS